jgi:lipoyl(octanoyl) transferase
VRNPDDASVNTLSVVQAGLVAYDTATRWQKELHARRVRREIPDVLLLLEHPHVYTLGRRFMPEHLLLDEAELIKRGISLHEADRGGSVTYHGPGQLVGYPIVDLSRPPHRLHPVQGSDGGEPDTIRYLRLLEEAMIRSVRSLGVVAGRREGLTGVWVGTTKLASIGVNVTRGVTKHGFALNVSTDLSYFDGMIPCGIGDAVMTSLTGLLGRVVAMDEVTGPVTANVAALLHLRPHPATLADIGLSLPGAGRASDGSAVATPSRPDRSRQPELQGSRAGAQIIPFPRAEQSAG